LGSAFKHFLYPVPMKNRLGIYLLFLFSFILVIFACRKSVSSITPVIQPTAQAQQTHNNSSDSVRPVPFPQTGITGCSYAPDYGDTLIYPQPTNGKDYTVGPLNNPGIGKYFSWPEGMIIDSSTGIIDVTKSETGERYVIGFVKTGTRDTCLQPLILAGGSYMDSVYVLGNNQYQCAPYFNANPTLISVCRGGGSGCQFDITGQAKNQKIVINNSTGVMDLQKTLQGGVFGLLPVDGQSVTTTIYYKLSDNSNYALQHIDITFMYYTSRSLIPANILNNIVTKRINILQSVLVTNSKNPRPPVIILTRFK
jgi:hypothetical protein